jgi:hypothetical protein
MPTLYGLLADLIVVVHLAFVAFVVLGGLSLLRWPWMLWLHLPSAAWGVLIEFLGWTCPLTPLENSLRWRAGREPYEGDFVAEYLLPVLYPEALTRDVQILLGSLVLIVNAVIYAVVLLRRRQMA